MFAGAAVSVGVPLHGLVFAADAEPTPTIRRREAEATANAARIRIHGTRCFISLL
jgi:hypothetical protein